ncbi:Helitron helicase-like domain-containing protein [Gossypium australe]|uniref:Helitron helicase-like domain-containing protein n=1 Tax=Gossypium australe TaxID=47621 RepID=A0A5B6WE38_9ROSI|nr:Helitron helicase-like domain-containing protein [Gossypium australe]
MNGKAQLPLLQEAPDFLKCLLQHNGDPRSLKFRDNIQSVVKSTIGLDLCCPQLEHNLNLHETNNKVNNRIGLIVGNTGEAATVRDVIVQDRRFGLRCINESHPSFMARMGMTQRDCIRELNQVLLLGRNLLNINTMISAFNIDIMKATLYYTFCLLTQQYICDRFTSIKAERFDWLLRNQTKLCANILQGLQDVVRGDTLSLSVGK